MDYSGTKIRSFFIPTKKKEKYAFFYNKIEAETI